MNVRINSVQIHIKWMLELSRLGILPAAIAACERNVQYLQWKPGWLQLQLNLAILTTIDDILLTLNRIQQIVSYQLNTIG